MVVPDQCLEWRNLGVRVRRSARTRSVRDLKAGVQERITDRVEWHCVVIE
jgi:hypothetical protein